MQNGFVRTQSHHVVPRVAALAGAWLDGGGDVVFTRYLNHPGSPFERIIGWTRLQHPPETDIVDGLAQYVAKAVAVLDKPIYSTFTPEGRALFAAHGWNQVFVCGIATESCVLKTAVDAFEADLTPWVVSDAVASHAGEEAHNAGLLVLGRFIGKAQIISASQALARAGIEAAEMTT